MLSIKNYKRTISWLLVILYLLLSPASNLPDASFINIPNLDKLVHATLFCVFALFFLYELYKKDKSLQSSILLVLLLSIIIGMLTEIIQYHYISGRNGNIYDFAADIVGTILGICFYIFFGKKFLEKFRT